MPDPVVEAVDLDVLALPRGADPAVGSLAVILISARGSDGYTGYGEIAAGPGRLALARAMSARVLGCNPFHLTRIEAEWQAGLDGRVAAGEIRAVAGGIATALADLQARHIGAPLFALLGGWHADRVPLAARLGPDPAAADRQASRGFATLVLESRSGHGFEHLRALRQRLGPEFGLRLDLAAQAPVVRARPIVGGSGDSWPEMIVDPADTIAGAARLHEDAAAPIALSRLVRDVQELAAAVRANAFDVWIADPIDVGGPSAFGRAAAVCRTFGIDVALDARRRTEVGAALALHLSATHRVINRALELAPDLMHDEGFLTEGLCIENGRCLVPNGPGLGIEPDPARIRACRIEHAALTRSEAGA